MPGISAFASSGAQPDQSAHYLDGQSMALATYGSPQAADRLYINELNSDYPRINTRSSTLGGPYYLSDAGKIQFYKHDRPSEFYGRMACLVRNETVRGIFVVRVPGGTPFSLIYRYKDLFEERQAAVDRQREYREGAPYIYEREVGVNCGYQPPARVQNPIVPYGNGGGHGNGGGQGNGGQNGFFGGATSHNVGEGPSTGSNNQANGSLGHNNGGHGRGFTSLLALDGGENGAHAGGVRTSMHQEPDEPDYGFGHRAHKAFIFDPASADLPPRHLDKKTNALYKTEMCRNWNEVGDCRYGRTCQFAHGQKELRLVTRHGQWKTKTCMAWLHGGCTYGSRCCYAHEVIPGGGTKGEFSKEEEPHGSPNSSEDSQPSLTNFFGGCGNIV